MHLVVYAYIQSSDFKIFKVQIFKKYDLLNLPGYIYGTAFFLFGS